MCGGGESMAVKDMPIRLWMGKFKDHEEACSLTHVLLFIYVVTFCHLTLIVVDWQKQQSTGRYFATFC